ncbi:MAG: helix-turn-helix domain-containing protein [Nitrospirota bacterium]|nr:helix-turn-helix domain-containing protein [Nitrospirota bacterium]
MKEKEEKLEIMRGSGNIFRDFGHPDAELRHLKCQLAAEIIGVLDDKTWSVRHAQKETGFDAGDFSRIRNADFRGITLDKMVRMLEKLNLRMKPMFEKIPRRSERKTNKDAHVLV